MRTRWCSVVGLLLALAATEVPASETVTVTLELRDVQADVNGEVVCRLFDEEGWLDAEVMSMSTSPSSPTLVFKVAAGRYAAACFHDSDGNGKLTFGWFWRPKEGSGFTRGYRPLGPPRFKKAAFDALTDVSQKVTLVYP